MHLRPGRIEELERENNSRDAALICHETLSYSGNDLPEAVCRGFYDRNAKFGSNLALRLGDHYLGWEIVEPL